MEYTVLGRTGLKVSVAGLGCGGPSRLGLRQNKSAKEAVALIKQALDWGVTLLDTAEAYGTEEIVGTAVSDVPRDRLVISTKMTLPSPGRENPEREVRKGLEESLRRLRTDYIDVYHLHGVEPENYPFAAGTLAPILLRLRAEGKIRFSGITEAFVPDPSHRMLARALEDDCWDVVMVGFSLLNQSARNVVFPKTIEKKVGVLNMFAVRRALSQPRRFADTMVELGKKGLLGRDAPSPGELVDFLKTAGKTSTLAEAAYRFCRYERGNHVVLTGTGNLQHLRENLESLAKPPLPDLVLERLRDVFGQVDSFSGN